MAGDDPTLVRDAMLTRMAMATPGGAMFRSTGPVQEQGYRFDEAQAYAASRKGLIAHTALMRLLAQAALVIREQLAAGEPVIIVAGGRELMRIEP